MTNKDLKNLIMGLIGGIILSFLLNSSEKPIESPTQKIVADTVTIQPKCPVIVLNKKSLLIGDSNSAFSRGWQTFVSEWTGLEIENTAVEGKATSWMKRKLIQNIDSTYEYCFIFGGGNDASMSVPPETIFKNIEQMVDICNEFGVQPVVILGTSPEKVMSINSSKWMEYYRIKMEYQEMLANELTSAAIIDTREVIEKSDCADFICHMKISGHKKIASRVISDMNFYRVIEN